MKKQIVLFTFFNAVFLISIKSQNMKTQLYIPTITEIVEKIDLNRFDLTEEFIETVYPDGTYELFENNEEGYTLLTHESNTCFIVSKYFYKNGYIKEKGLNYAFGEFKIGNWYYYNDSGKLENSINFDSSFKFNYLDVFKFMKENKIQSPLGHGEGGFYTYIYKKENSKVKSWKIEWLKDTTSLPNIIESIELDGQNGTIINKSEHNYLNN